MRKFTSKEKSYLSKLCENAKPSAGYLAANLFKGIFQRRGIGYVTDSHKLSFYRQGGDIDESKIIEITDKIIEVSLLLDYLEREGMIAYVQDTRPMPSGIGIQEKEELHNSGLVEITKDLSPEAEAQLLKALKHRVIAGQTLQEYVANGYQSYEDLQLAEAKKIAKWARYSFFAIIAALLLMALLPLIMQSTT